MFKQIISLPTLTVRRGYIIFNDRYLHTANITRKKVIVNSREYRLQIRPVYFSDIALPQNLRLRKLYSSDSLSTNIHKVLFVSASSPDIVENKTTGSDAEQILVTSTDATPVESNEIPSVATEASKIWDYSDPVITYIPPPPVPPEVLNPPLNALGEPTLTSLGLGGWSPVGLIQYIIEFFHVSLNLQWWAAIALLTFILRLSMSPLVIISQQNAAKITNLMPTMHALQKKMTDARNSGNNLEAARIAYELQEVMKKGNISPAKNLLLPLMQAPVFISMFIALRQCCNLPVESFKTGGLVWFTDLTITDPYFLLPIFTCVTLFITIEVGTEGRPMIGPNAKLMKYVLRALPVCIFPFILNFPSGLLCYWASTNIFSLGQVAFLKIHRVRDYFQIDPPNKTDETAVHSKDNRGFVASIKESYSNMKLAAQVRDRYKVDEMKFRKAGMGPLVKTYKYNPLENKTAIKAKGQAK